MFSNPWGKSANHWKPAACPQRPPAGYSRCQKSDTLVGSFPAVKPRFRACAAIGAHESNLQCSWILLHRVPRALPGAGMRRPACPQRFAQRFGRVGALAITGSTACTERRRHPKCRTPKGFARRVNASLLLRGRGRGAVARDRRRHDRGPDLDTMTMSRTFSAHGFRYTDSPGRCPGLV